MFVHHFPIGVAAAVGHPNAAAGPHDRVQGRRQAAGRPHAVDFVAFVDMDVRLAVGHDDELGLAKSLAHRVFQSLSCPSHVVLLYVRCDVQRQEITRRLPR